jgi:hypothetical protein
MLAGGDETKFLPVIANALIDLNYPLLDFSIWIEITSIL